MSSLRQVAKKVVPAPAVRAYRRRQALRKYLQSISYEIYDRNRVFELEELEGELLARRPDITSRLMKDLLLRTDALIQQLERQVEGLRARHGTELRALREEVESLRAAVEALRTEVRHEASHEDDSPAQSPAGRGRSE